MDNEKELKTDNEKVPEIRKQIEEADKKFDISKYSDMVIILTNEIKQALDVLIQSAEIAQKNGCFSLQDAAYVSHAVNILSKYCGEENDKNENKI